MRFDKKFDWSTGLLVCLEQIKEDYVIIMLEDFFLRTPINNEDIINALTFLHEHEGHSLKLIPNPVPDQRISWGGKNYYGEFSIGRPYRVNLQGAIWHKKTLERIIQRGETAWQFEVQGTQRAEAIKSGFYGVYVPLLTYGHHVVEKGKWFRQEAAYWGNQDIGCDFSEREIMSSKEMLFWRYRKRVNIVKSVVKSTLYKIGVLK